MPEPATTNDLEIRPLAPGEASALAAIMRRSFGGIAGMMFSAGQAAYVAELGGRMVGGVTLAAFRIDARRRGGVVKWVFTLPEARGRGVASALIDRALVWFREQGVSDAFACIEGHNAGSGNRFAGRGFEPLGFVEQVRRYGAALMRVWWHASHVADVGHFMWARRLDGDVPDVKPAQELGDDPAAAWGLGGFSATLALHAVFGVSMLARLGHDVDLLAAAQVALAVVLVVGVRTAAMALTGRALGLRLRYRPWETGMTLTGAISLLFGGTFVAPGGLYPRARTWSLRALGPRLAGVAAAGAVAVLALGWVAHLVVASTDAASTTSAAVAAPVLFFARFLLIFDVLLPVFPFTAFAARRVLEASRPAWVLLALGTIGLWVASLA